MELLSEILRCTVKTVPLAAFPAQWVPLAWTDTAAILVVMGSAGADLFLARRYAGGGRGHDGGLWGILVLSLAGNIGLAFVLSYVGIGRVPYQADWMTAWGVVLGLLGLLFRYGAIWQMGRLFTWRVTIQDRHELVTHGLFGRIRHPSYAGGLLGATGIILALGNWVALAVFWLTHVPLVLRRITLEERALAAHFGTAYREYAKRTWRLVPGLY